jgi:hypothetical protein
VSRSTAGFAAGSENLQGRLGRATAAAHRVLLSATAPRQAYDSTGAFNQRMDTNEHGFKRVPPIWSESFTSSRSVTQKRGNAATLDPCSSVFIRGFFFSPLHGDADVLSIPSRILQAGFNFRDERMKRTHRRCHGCKGRFHRQPGRRPALRGDVKLRPPAPRDSNLPRHSKTSRPSLADA